MRGKADGAGACTDNAYSSGVVLLSGTIVPGQGMVPLGLTAGLDDPDTEDGTDQADGVIDHKPGLVGAPASGDVIVDFAPQHDGLEGNKLATLAIALTSKAFPRMPCLRVPWFILPTPTVVVIASPAVISGFPKATTIVRRTLWVLSQWVQRTFIV